MKFKKPPFTYNQYVTCAHEQRGNNGVSDYIRFRPVIVDAQEWQVVGENLKSFPNQSWGEQGADYKEDVYELIYNSGITDSWGDTLYDRAYFRKI